MLNYVSSNFDYSTKNIPIPDRKQYLKCMINKTEKFIRNMRWKAFFYLNPDSKQNDKETFGFKSTKPAPLIPELKEFEDGLLNIIQNINFRQTNDVFQKKLKEDITAIKNDNRVYVKADKTNNFYKITPEEYDKLLDKNVQKDYKKDTRTTKPTNTTEDKCIAEKLQLSDRIDTPAQNNAFITLKDHKPNFKNNPQCRLINPCKTEIGKISKQILDRINKTILQKTKLNQWKNTGQVIDWYKNIGHKPQHTAIVYDICNFYPSISKELLYNALEFGSKFTSISKDEKHIIMHCKKTYLYHKDERWSKKDSDFDVTMGSYDGAETCELVGLYILSQMQHLNINIGLYRDDGLAIGNNTPRQTEIIKKEICKIFNSNGLTITIEANKKIVDFLDITLDLHNGTYRPYSKPNNTPLYVHNKSNHPPSIIKNIPLSINKRLSSNSSDATIFNDSTRPYNEALKKSGYKFNLKFTESSDNKTKTSKRKRTRQILWYTPPFSMNVTSRIGRKFIALLTRCFPKENDLHHIFNRNTVKISYSTMPNVENIISTHNKNILNKHRQPKTDDRKLCNCRNSEQCPLDGKCLTDNVVYKATITTTDPKTQQNHTETYTGLTECEFKTRYNLHKSSFKNQRTRKATTLSEHIHSLKDRNIEHKVNWTVTSRAKPYSPTSKICSLCLEEKYTILYQPHSATLNKRNELYTACRHRRKHLLCNYT